MSTQDLKKVIEKAERRLAVARTEAKPPTSINDVFDRCSPEWDHPDHLRPYVEQLEKAVIEGDVAICFHAPPQHGKSETAKHALMFYAFVKPGKRHAYVTYNADRAIKVRNDVEALAQKAGLEPHTAGQLMTLKGGTEIQFVGRGGGLTGNPIDGILIVDDILKDDIEASSPVTREACWEWLLKVAFTRCHPGSSKLVMMTRWSKDDLIGRLVSLRNWVYIRLAAVCDAPDDPCGREIGEALWRSQRPLEWLKDQMEIVGPRAAESMYQGHPRAEGDALFNGSSYYDTLPTGGYRALHGVDLAYTEKTRADWSVMLSGRLYPDGHIYLTHLLRQQVQADVFTPRMAAAIQTRPGPVLWYGNTVERGAAQLIRTTIPTFQFRLATSDKYVRACPTAEKLWNVGRIHVPSDATWGQAFVRRVEDFTGEKGGQDDDVDALGALGDLALEYCQQYDGKEFNRRLRDKFHGHLRVV